MSDKTGIQWTDATWNPTVGCDRVSPGCARCYAKALHDKRHKAFLAGKRLPEQYAEPFETLQMIESRLDAPLHWRTPRRIFVNSVSDLFYGDEGDRIQAERDGRPFNPVPDAFIDRVFAVMALAPRHTFQILTKRAERMREYLSMKSPDGDRCDYVAAEANERTSENDDRFSVTFLKRGAWPLPNVWLGPSIENLPMADRRFPIACALGADGWNVMVSMEPLLSEVNVPERFLALGSRAWVIVGGESGRQARPFAIEWARSIIAQCQAAGVPVFMKQLGALPTLDGRGPDTGAPARGGTQYGLRDSHGGDMAEWPADLRRREFPRGGHT